MVSLFHKVSDGSRSASRLGRADEGKSYNTTCALATAAAAARRRAVSCILQVLMRVESNVWNDLDTNG